MQDLTRKEWENIHWAETLALGLVTGSALWMVIVLRDFPYRPWRSSLLADSGLILTAGTLAVCAAIQIRRKNESRKQQERKAVPNREAFWQAVLPDTFPQALLWAFILTMVLLQAGRLNIELDYDSLHYGLRSGFVLDNGKGIYETWE